MHQLEWGAGFCVIAGPMQDYCISDERKEAQSTVDKQLVPLVAAVPSLRQYLSHKFTLSHGQFPHKMSF